MVSLFLKLTQIDSILIEYRLQFKISLNIVG